MKEQHNQAMIYVFVMIATIVIVTAGAYYFMNKQSNSEEVIQTQVIQTDLEKAYTPPIWIDDGDTQYVNDSKAYIRATKVSLNPTIEFMTKNYNGGVNVLILMDTQYLTPVDVKFNPRLVEFENSYTCEHEFNYTQDYFWCYEIVNLPEHEGEHYIHFEHSYDRGNLQTKTAYWNDVRTEWIDISGAFIKVPFNFYGMNTAYYKEGFQVTAGELYTLKLRFAPTKFTSKQHKYWVVFYPSNYGIDYKQAILDNNLYALDPWTADLSVGLQNYYKLDTSIGAIVDSIGTEDANIKGTITRGTPGIIENATNVSASNTANINWSTGSVASFSINFWERAFGTPDDWSGGVNPELAGTWKIFSRRNAALSTWSAQINGGNFCLGTANVIDGAWHMITLTLNSTTAVQYVDGAYDCSFAHSTAIPLSDVVTFMSEGSAGRGWNGAHDEIGWWVNRTLSPTDVSTIYNGGSGLSYESPAPPTVTILYPEEIIYNQTTTNITYVQENGEFCWYSIDIGATNSSSVSAGTNFSVSGVVGWNNYTVWCNSTGGQVGGDKTDFFIDKGVGTDLGTPTASLQTTNSTFNFVWNSTAANTNLTNTTLVVWFSNGSVVYENYTSLSGNTTTTTIREREITTEGTFTWGAKTCGEGVICVDATNRTFTYHSTAPTISIFSPRGVYGAAINGSSLVLNWSASENVANLTAHIQNCSYTYNAADFYLDPAQCTITNTTTLTYISGVNNLTMNITDIFNLTFTNSTSWVVVLSEISQTYNNFTVEGSLETFDIRVSTDPSYEILTASLNYNSTSYPGTLTNEGSNVYNATKQITIPQIGTPVNITFYWSFTLNDSTVVTSLSHNQTILNISIDNCTVGTEVLYNFTIVDEDTQTKLAQAGNETNTTAKINIQIYNYNGLTQIESYENLFTKINPFAICLNNNLTGGGSLKTYAQLEYSALAYATEFYHIQNETVNSTDFPTYITLYDLNNTRNQPFKITYKDESFIAVSDALINITRRYIEEGVYKSVEVPKTDSFGETIGNFVVNDVIYTFIVSKNGQILGTFTDQRVVCQNPTIEECVINLNSFRGSIPVTDFEEELDLSYTLSHNKESRTTSVTYSVPSGTSSVFLMNVTKQDAINTFACSDTLTSSAGTLSCTIPASIGNSTVKASLYRDGVLVAGGTLSFDQTPSQIYGVVLVILGFFVFLTLIGVGISDNPIFTVLFLMVGVILLFALNLVSNNGFIGASATILFLVIAIILIVIKGGKRD